MIFLFFSHKKRELENKSDTELGKIMEGLSKKKQVLINFYTEKFVNYIFNFYICAIIITSLR